jgi:hypothetical protein
MKRITLFGIIIGLMLFTACRDKDLDMTVMNKTLYEGATINEIMAKDAWNISIVQDTENSFVELEYSAFLEDYLKVQLDGSSLFVGFTRHLYFPSNTVMNATIHTPMVHKLSFSDAVFAALDNLNLETDLTLELEDASSCRGGHFYGDAELKLNDAATCVELYVEGTNCTVELADASVLKGCFYMDGDLNLTVKDASRFTDYWGEINHAVAEVSDASSLNMATSWINRMYIEVHDASEATVNVVESLEGKVRDASKLYYSGDPTLNVDCDETSIIQQVDYPNP